MSTLGVIIVIAVLVIIVLIAGGIYATGVRGQSRSFTATFTDPGADTWDAVVSFGDGMTVRLPLCARHAARWRRRNLVALVGLCLVLMPAAAAVADMLLRPDVVDTDLRGWLCLGSMLMLLVGVMGTSVAQSRDARPTRITDRSLGESASRPDLSSLSLAHSDASWFCVS